MKNNFSLGRNPMTTESSRFVPHNYPHIIELAGVAGAGKSTLLKALRKKNSNIKPFPYPVKTIYLPFLFRMCLKWLPLYLKSGRKSRWFNLQEIRNMAYLDTLLFHIRSRTRNKKDIYVLDPGSVYWLSSLQAFGPQITRHPLYQSWWKNKFEQWSSGLDAIIWLDAPVDECLQRVLSRDEWHDIKEMNSEDAMAEVKCYREYYEQIIPQIAHQFSIRIFHFHTDQTSTEQMVEMIFSDAAFWMKLDQPSKNDRASL
jgi:hypothetical protein